MSIWLQKTRAWMRPLLLASLIYLLWMAGQRISAVMAVQNAVNRDWEISFGYGWSGTTGKPVGLPHFVDAAVSAWFERRYAHTAGYDGSLPAKSRNRSTVYFERFRSLFRGPIHEIHVYYPETIPGDLGAALARFRGLRHVTVKETDDTVTEPDWKRLCTRLREFPNLEEIELLGPWLTDDAISPLAGHPRLRVIHISMGRLSVKCKETFATIPRLALLHIEQESFDDDEWISPLGEEELRVTLPHVAIELP